MQINLIADSSISSAPAGFTAAVQQAANIFDSLFPGNYTINIRYGWGTWDNQADPGLIGMSGAEGGPVNGTTVSYATLKSWLTADYTLPDQQAALASLPSNNASFPDGGNTFYVSSAQEKAFNVYSGSGSAVDGAIGFGTGTTSQYFLEAALHEIGHALGRTTDFYAGVPTIEDLFRYSAPGTHDWTGYDPAYLSFNGGNTDLANFSTVSDFVDFAVDPLTPNDPFNWMVNGTDNTLSSLDIQLMNALGFGSVAASPSIVLTSVVEISVAAGQAIAASTLVNSISNPHNDTIGQYLYLDNGGGSGYFTVNGVAQPDGEWIFASSSETVQYVGGQTPGSDQLELGIYDATTHSYAYSSLFSAITTGSETQNTSGSDDADWQLAGVGHFGGTSASEMLLRDGNNGQFDIYYVNNVSTSETSSASGGTPGISLGQVGLNYQVVGFGDFHGSPSETDMLLQDTSTGALEVYDINNNAITFATAMGQVGLNWQAVGFGDFSGSINETDMLMRDINTGAFELYDISNNSIAAAASMGQVGLNWQIAGFGDFSSNANETDMLLRDANTGAFELYDIHSNTITSAASMGQVGLDWHIIGFGDFSGNANETDMLLRNANTGSFELYDINHNNITLATTLGSVGLDWQVYSLGDFSGNSNETDMLLRNSNTGAFELYDIKNNAITSATALGDLGLSAQLAGGGSTISTDDSGTPSAPSPSNTNTVFVFLGNFGQSSVQQFDPLIDSIELSATEFPNFAAVQSHMEQSGANTLITYNADNSITLVGVPMSSLHASNFEFTYGYVQ